MIRIAVVSYNNQRSLEPLSAVFGRDSATLGRSEENFFVLPDSKHLVSRVQAAIKSDGQQHTIVSLSQANPVILNGNELKFQVETAFKPGDEIQVGPYVLLAEAYLAPVSEMPLHAAPAMDISALANSIGDSGAAHDSQVLLQAFLQGAGIPEMSVGAGLTPEFMETVGKLLAATVDGTYALVGSRAMTKREVNADVTMVVVRNNNPLKFLPDSHAVLM
ncbi:MAG: FHA domain-containing protein, partial [Pseudomonadota bacterium]|nr:FHA domain-containing protein [Pseudomonadota bacterium]